MQKFHDALQQLKDNSAEELDLNGINLSFAKIESLTKALLENRGLLVLKLSNNGIT